MTLYRIVKGDSGRDTDLVKIESRSFSDENLEKRLDDWVELKPKILDPDDLLIIGRGVYAGEFGEIDLLAIDRKGNLVVIENKRGGTPEKTIAQILKYLTWGKKQKYSNLNEIASNYFGEDYKTLQEAHKIKFLGSESDPLSEEEFNKDQRGIIFGFGITRIVEEVAKYLKDHDLEVQCHEFNYYSREEEELIDHEIRVDKIEKRPEEQYLDFEGCLNFIQDEEARATFMDFVMYMRGIRGVAENFSGIKGSSFGFDKGRKRWINGYTAQSHFKLYIRGKYKHDDIDKIKETFPDVITIHPEWVTSPYEFGEISFNVKTPQQLEKLKEILEEYQ